MQNFHVVTQEGKKMAVLPLAAYKRMVSALENLEDERDAQRAEAIMARIKSGAEPLIPGDVVHAILDGVHPVRAWRMHRKLTAEKLAQKAGISRAYLTQIEGGKRKGTALVLRSLAKALKTDIDSLIG